MSRKFKREEKRDVFADRRRERELDKLRRELIKQPTKTFNKQKPTNYKNKPKKD